MSSYARPVVSKESDIWVLRLQKDNGKVQEYSCTTESQARQLALVLTASAVVESKQPQA
jgi:outer membrane lipopolysaccharide assembly protein LptE/RlpB